MNPGNPENRRKRSKRLARKRTRFRYDASQAECSTDAKVDLAFRTTAGNLKNPSRMETLQQAFALPQRSNQVSGCDLQWFGSELSYCGVTRSEEIRSPTTGIEAHPRSLAYTVHERIFYKSVSD